MTVAAVSEGWIGNALGIRGGAWMTVLARRRTARGPTT
jgi:hypothetical protein